MMAHDANELRQAHWNEIISEVHSKTMAKAALAQSFSWFTLDA
jgi:hypothetical protein